jgi:hypothetical protein
LDVVAEDLAVALSTAFAEALERTNNKSMKGVFGE